MFGLAKTSLGVFDVTRRSTLSSYCRAPQRVRVYNKTLNLKTLDFQPPSRLLVLCCSCSGRSWFRRASRRSTLPSYCRVPQRGAPQSLSLTTWAGRAAWPSPPSSTSKWPSWRTRRRCLRLDQSLGMPTLDIFQLVCAGLHG